MSKERYTVSASSLGSYFGVGFNDPIKQLLIDMGQIEDEPDEEAEDRMEIGNILEDASLNVLEYKLGIKIGNRNVEVVTALDGMLRFKIDGEAIYNGEETIIENKISNSKSGPFTKNKGYEFQVQAYMMAKGYNQAILGGLYHGRPVWRIVKRDDEMIEDIKHMVSKVYGILNGIIPMEDFPWELVEKYSKKVIVKEMDVFDTIEDSEYLDELSEANKVIKEWTDRKEGIVNYFKSKYNALAYQNDKYTLSIGKYVKEGGFDEVSFAMENPEIDLSRYRKEPVEITTVRINKKKGS